MSKKQTNRPIPVLACTQTLSLGESSQPRTAASPHSPTPSRGRTPQAWRQRRWQTPPAGSGWWSACRWKGEGLCRRALTTPKTERRFAPPPSTCPAVTVRPQDVKRNRIKSRPNQIKQPSWIFPLSFIFISSLSSSASTLSSLKSWRSYLCLRFSIQQPFLSLFSSLYWHCSPLIVFRAENGTFNGFSVDWLVWLCAASLLSTSEHQN